MSWPFLLYINWLGASFVGKFDLAEFYRWVLVLWLKPNLKVSGTKFQQAVWQKISSLGWGQTLSYAQLARQLQKPKAFRAVANACGANPWPFIVPCQRVVASHFEPKRWRNLGGFGLGVELKLALLKLEIN